MSEFFAWRELQTIGIGKLTIFFLCRLLVSIRFKIKKLFPNKTKIVLLAGTSEVTVFDLLDVDEIIAEIGDKQSYMLVSSGTRRFAQVKLLEYGVKIPLISLPQALCTPWDLIIFADHNNTRWFHPDIPKIKYGHGLTSGKSYGPGGSWAYGQSALDSSGEPLYKVMFVESVYYQDAALCENPALKSNLAVVGSLMADKLLTLNKDRVAIRQELGLKDEDKVLIIISTWGPKSLIQRFGMHLLDQLPEIGKDYKIYFIIHPLNDSLSFADKNALWERLESYARASVAMRVDPTQPWFPYLVAADIMLTDHTSLSLYYALLEKPLFFVPIATEAIGQESLIWRLYQLQKPYNLEINLKNQLEQTLERFCINRHREVVDLVLNERGNAKQRILTEIARFW